MESCRLDPQRRWGDLSGLHISSSSHLHGLEREAQFLHEGWQECPVMTPIVRGPVWEMKGYVVLHKTGGTCSLQLWPTTCPAIPHRPGSFYLPLCGGYKMGLRGPLCRLSFPTLQTRAYHGSSAYTRGLASSLPSSCWLGSQETQGQGGFLQPHS